jgi:hypothetical protein
MIWGCQYDAMMNWMAKNGVTVGSSTIMGNTIKNTTTVTGNPNFNDKLKNVYDIYGGGNEYTLEAASYEGRAIRGANSAPSHRGYGEPDSSTSTQARITLYIN